MRSGVCAGAVIALGAIAMACGGSTPRQQAAVQVRQGTPAAERGTGPSAKALEVFGSRAPVEPVEFELLEPFLPAFSGWERSAVQGEKTLTPVSVSQVQADYRRGAATINASIVDSGFNQSFMAPFAVFLVEGFSKETPTGYERAVTAADHPGWERWDSQTKNGELSVLVARRYVVLLDGVDIEGPKVLHELLRRFELGKLGQLK